MSAAPAPPSDAAAPLRPFFGVERSLSGRVWRERPADLAATEALRRRFQLPEVAARLLAARGVGPDAADRFLNPTMRDYFPNPSTFADMDLAAEILDDAIVSGRRCAVFADYDVDGGTSAALLVKYFRGRGRDLIVYVPDRQSEGYGPNAQAFDRLKSQGAELVVTVDCGAVAVEPLAHAQAIGLEVVVFDHHLMGGRVAPAQALVNPNRPDCASGQGHLTAAGVVLVALAAINRTARRRGSPGANHLPEPMQLLDLAALGTVCDVAPLTGFNRAIVAQGLKILSQGGNIGLKALAERAGKAKLGQVYDLGFVLGPRLNAGGRIGDAGLAARLLATEDPAEAAAIAVQLEGLNAERRRLCDEILQIAALGETASSVAVLGRPEWHPGVIGVVAGRLKERARKPVIVLGGGGPDEPAKGSGRSISGVNLGRAVAEAASLGLLRAGGGHAMAAGLTLDWAAYQPFVDFLEERLAPEVAAAADDARTLWIDAAATPRAATPHLMAALDRIGPYGPGHAEPVFAFADVRVAFAKPMKGGRHYSATLEDQSGGKIRAVAFGAGDGPLGEALSKRDALLHVAVKLQRNDFGGAERIEAEILDAALA